jgi:SAM-dependent methyltransferase
MEMEVYDWDSKIDYLSKTRGLYFNDDYIEFLVRTVWKIDKPIRLIDFGCGYGYLGLKLLPLLPEGSKYTGIDAGEQLIRRAREIYQKLPIESEFLVGDIQEFACDRRYDMVVCHAFLLHVPNPTEVLRKMLHSVVDGGRIACFEPHWISSMASAYLHGIDPSAVVRLGLPQRLFEEDAKRTGKDGNIGLKLPIYLTQLGVRDVECRVSDKVNFLNPDSAPEQMGNLYESLREDGVGAAPPERVSFISNLIGRGLSDAEAVLEYETELRLSQMFHQDSYYTCAPNMMITYGTVGRG